MPYQRGPSFTTAFLVVWVAGAMASTASGYVLWGVLARSGKAVFHGTSSAEFVALYLGGRLAIGTVLGTVLAYAFLSLDGTGVSLGRAFGALLVGNALGFVVLAGFVTSGLHASSTDASAAAPLVATVRSLAFLPLSWLGYAVSAVILAGGGPSRPESAEGTPWEYKLPPGAEWRR